MLTSDLRSAFLSFFRERDHTVVPSASLLPGEDPSLLFVNAGMVPFKRVFMGNETRPYTRATSSQKCVRAGGKHNDLNMVGFTKRHHTFFEMLGNFSFGDYFKEEAIVYAWDFLVKTLGLDAQRLWITVYHEDEEARTLWKKISGFSDARILSIDTSDNFWSMGDTGPCGPSTEIFYDHGEHLPGGLPGTSEEDGDRFVEIWNLVFMQFDQQPGDKRIPLPKPGVDTGIGLERLTAVMQGVDSNYDTDIFQALRARTAEIVCKKPTESLLPSFNVITDHIRSAAFLMADGITPSTEGRGYVLRRIIRRAVMHGKRLGQDTPFLSQLFPTLVHSMGHTHEELARATGVITSTLTREEDDFHATIARARDLVSDWSAGLKRGDVFLGDQAFKLYDTYGLPLDALEDMLSPLGVSVDHKGFESAMNAQKQRGKAHQKFSDADGASIYDLLGQKLPATQFTGYTATKENSTLLAIVKNSTEVQSTSQGETVELITEKTPFYGESGGQQGDQGTIQFSNAILRVDDTQKAGALFLHKGTITEGTLKTGEIVTLAIDTRRRLGLRIHHSATHLLHAALRETLGDHVVQKGSLVAQDRLRFDFSHFERLSQTTLKSIETKVNQAIRCAHTVTTCEMPVAEAKAAGAMALFGENYGDTVRVVTMSANAQEISSKELCGGTHVTHTSEIGFFKILSETGVAKGIRRIEAVAGEAAITYIDALEETVQRVRTLLGGQDVVERTKRLTEEVKRFAQERKRAEMAPQTATTEDLKDCAGEITLFVRIVEGASMDLLRTHMDTLRAQHPQSVLVILGKSAEKIPILLGVEGLDTAAPQLFRDLFHAYGGKGGGKRSLAQGGLERLPNSTDLMTHLKNALIAKPL